MDAPLGTPPAVEIICSRVVWCLIVLVVVRYQVYMTTMTAACPEGCGGLSRKLPTVCSGNVKVDDVPHVLLIVVDGAPRALLVVTRQEGGVGFPVYGADVGGGGVCAAVVVGVGGDVGGVGFLFGFGGPIVTHAVLPWCCL